MNKEELEKEKLQAEIKKLITEEEKAREEIRLLQLPVFMDTRVLVACLVAVIGLCTTGFKWYLTAQERDAVIEQKKAVETEKNRAVAEKKDIEKNYVKDVQTLISNGKSDRSNIVIKFRGSISREQISGLQEKFNQNNYLATRPFRTVSIQNDEITYFAATEKEKKTALAIKREAENYFADLNCPIKDGLKLRYDTNSDIYQKGAFVLSVFHQCK